MSGRFWAHLVIRHVLAFKSNALAAARNIARRHWRPVRGEIELSQLPNPIGRAMYTAVCHSCTAVAQVTPVTAVVLLNVQLAVSVANRDAGATRRRVLKIKILAS